MITYYHNPQCSKSRHGLSLLESSGIPFNVCEYLKTPPSRDEISQLVLGYLDDPRDLVREPLSATSDVVDFLFSSPALMQRPLLFFNQKTILGRPVDTISKFISEYRS